MVILKVKTSPAFSFAIILLAFIILPRIPAGIADPNSSPGEYRMSLTGDQVQVSVSTVMNQNATQTPAYSITLKNENASALSNYIRRSIQLLTPSAIVEGVVLGSSSNGTLTRIDLQFRVSGVSSTDQWGASQLDLTWRGFKVDDDIIFGGVSVNLVGKHYLSNPLLELVNASFHPLQGLRISFELNGQIATPLEVQQMAPTINLLDFSRLQTPLASWSRDSSILSPAATWTRNTGFQLVGKQTIQEPLGEVTTISSSVSYEYKAVLQVPNFLSFQQDHVIYGASILEPVMVAIILTASGLGLGTYVLDRRLTSTRRFKSKKGKN